MDKRKLEEVLNLPIPELSEQLSQLSTQELTALRELESADNDPRKGALEAIDQALAAAAKNDKPNQAEPPPAAKSDTKEAAAAPAPAWQAPDYSGPLTCDQMQWRIHNTKPVKKVRTK